jgi:uncharacterized heparinase superfamily protein
MSEDGARSKLTKAKPPSARKVKPAETYETGPQQLVREAPRVPSLVERLATTFGTITSKVGLGAGGGGFPQKLLIAPDSLWRGDATKGAAISRGLLTCPGFKLDTNSQRFVDVQASPAVLSWLHGFDWLRDLSAAYDGASGAAFSERLVKLWLQDATRSPAIAHRPDVLGRRLMMWLGHATMILSSTDQVYRSAVLTALAQATKHLYKTVERADDGLPLLEAATGLILAGLALPGREAAEAKGAQVLEAALDRLVGPDGGFGSRSPEDMLSTLKLLLTLRAAYQARGQAHPGGLLRAIDRLVPALRGLILGDGCLTTFHGGSMVTRAGIDDVLAMAAVSAKPLKNAAHSGYQRLEGGRAVVVMDAGPPPSGKLSQKAHTGVLAFEFSDGPQRLIVNCGGDGAPVPAASGNLVQALRMTAAQSTLVLGNSNATEIRPDGFLGKGVEEVVATRQENQDGSWIDARHDGYEARFGYVHRRRLFLKSDGMDLRGEDIIEQARSGKGKAGVPVDVRFHLAPGVTAVATQGGGAAALKLPGGAAWMFRAKNAVLHIADSIHVSPQGSRKTSQLILSTVTTVEGACVNWVLQRQAK